MKDKELIEEMAKIIKDNSIIDVTYGGKPYADDYENLARKLLEHYQPKLPKDVVIVSKQVWEEHIENWDKTTKAVEERVRKETAEKILKEFDDLQEDLSKKIKQLKEPFNYVSMNSKEKEGYKNGILAAKSIVTSFKSQLAKQFDAEADKWNSF